MRKLLIPSLVLFGCWTASKPASTTKPAETTASSTGGAAYGGAAYGGAQYGVLGSTALTQGGAFASLTGAGDISSGFDDPNIYGGLVGSGSGGGFGSGGGGTGWGTIGTGRYGTIGSGAGSGSGSGSGYGVGGRGGMRGRANIPTVSVGQPNHQGDLDAAIIRRYIKRNIQKIQYCYEKTLLSKPSLAGTLTIRFTINPDGIVISSTGSGMPGVDSCVADVIKSIEFPKPKGGGSVIVNYPFTFSNGGSTP